MNIFERIKFEDFKSRFTRTELGVNRKKVVLIAWKYSFYEIYESDGKYYILGAGRSGSDIPESLEEAFLWCWEHYKNQ